MTQEVGKKNEGWIQDLPKAPVPDLQVTLGRYLASLKAILPSGQYEQTVKTVSEFVNQDQNSDSETSSLGFQLQQDLLEFAANSDNWVTKLWIEDMYLSCPLPLLINSNPFYMLPKQSFKTTNEQFKFAAEIIKFCHEFKVSIMTETLSQDLGPRGVPLCMNTYKNFFTSCRIPGSEIDTLNILQEPSGHFVVASRNQFFTVKLTANEITDEELVIDALKCINQLSKEGQNLNNVQPIGLMTCENRRVWSNVRDHLLEISPRNRSSLEQIENCEFILCLDDFISIKGTSAATFGGGQRRDSIQRAKCDTSYMASQLLTGGGSDFYTPNRWYDKMLQFVIGRDGICGVVCEHSGSEGITILRFLELFLDQHPSYASSSVPGTSSSSSSGLIGIQRQDSSVSSSSGSKVQVGKRKSGDRISRFQEKILPLNFDVDEILSKHFLDSAKKINRMIDDLDIHVLIFQEFGKNFIKSSKCSPDAFVQLALQLTYYKVHRKLVSSYESGALRTFKNGRVDNIRSATIEALDWCRAMCDEQPESDVESDVESDKKDKDQESKVLELENQKIQLFNRAITKQVEILKYTISGHGPDNHLLGLREMARQKLGSYELVPLFKEKAYKEFLNFQLSTSNLSTEYDIIVGYGPVVPDGYGVSYNPQSDKIVFVISSFFSSNLTKSDFYARSLEGSLGQMREICLKINTGD